MKAVPILTTAIALCTVTTAQAAEDLVWIKDGKHTAKVNFDSHRHVEDLLGKPAVLERVQQAQSVFEARSKQDYCWTWYNRSEEGVKVSIQIGRTAG